MQFTRKKCIIKMDFAFLSMAEMICFLLVLTQRNFTIFFDN